MIDTLFTVILALAMAGVGIFCGTMAWQILMDRRNTRRMAKLSETWPGVDGHVMQRELVHEGVRAGWRPIITYVYSVGDQEYTGKLLTFEFSETYMLREAQEVIEHHPVHQRVTVYYDPENPATSVLERGGREVGPLGMVFIPLVLLLPASFCICVGLAGFSTLWQR